MLVLVHYEKKPKLTLHAFKERGREGKERRGERGRREEDGERERDGGREESARKGERGEKKGE